MQPASAIRVRRPVFGAIVLAASVTLASFCVAGYRLAPVLHNLPAIVAVTSFGALLLAVASARALALFRPLARKLEGIATEAAGHAIHAQAQNSLDANINLLRELLYTLGEPRRRGDHLVFGDTPINGNFQAVDQVKVTFGGTATVFLGDQRISTNVQQPDGSRAVGTALAAGPVKDTVLGQGKTFRGEAEILGAAYFSIYEPITSGGEVIGLLYVGVKKSDFTAGLTAPASSRDDLAAIQAALETLAAANDKRRQADADALVQRQNADDARRRYEVVCQVAAEAQRGVVGALSRALGALSAGRLDAPITAAFAPEFQKLKTDYNQALAALAGSMDGINAGAGLIRQGTNEIADAVNDLSRRTEQQAASLEQTAAALDQITATVGTSAARAREAACVVAGTRDDAQKSGEVVAEAVAAMGGIERSARQITNIIGVIDEIAFQTNLLALNAGVEAARAGDSGRGFAVVAQEVRALAQRSAAAAKEINALIAQSSIEVERGVRLVGNTGTALTGIATKVKDINGLVAEIATGCAEQATSLAEVNAAINQMDQVTQQNAAMVQQATAASANLKTESDGLYQLVAQFKTAPPPARPRRAVAAGEYA